LGNSATVGHDLLTFLVSKFIILETIDNLLADLGYGTDFADQFGAGESVAAKEIGVLAALDFKLKDRLQFHHVIALCSGRPFAEKCDECQQFLFDLLRTDALLLHPQSRRLHGREALETAGIGPVTDDAEYEC
jgi:hypothetical protein